MPVASSFSGVSGSGSRARKRARLGERLGERQRRDARALLGRQQQRRTLVQELAQQLALRRFGLGRRRPARSTAPGSRRPASRAGGRRSGDSAGLPGPGRAPEGQHQGAADDVRAHGQSSGFDHLSNDQQQAVYQPGARRLYSALFSTAGAPDHVANRQESADRHLERRRLRAGLRLPEAQGAAPGQERQGLSRPRARRRFGRDHRPRLVGQLGARQRLRGARLRQVPRPGAELSRPAADQGRPVPGRRPRRRPRGLRREPARPDDEVRHRRPHASPGGDARPAR